MLRILEARSAVSEPMMTLSRILKGCGGRRSGREINYYVASHSVSTAISCSHLFLYDLRSLRCRKTKFMQENEISPMGSFNQFVRNFLFIGIAMHGISNWGQGAVSIDWVTIGDAGNPNDTSMCCGQRGAVGYEYQVSRFETTNSQYVDFLNAVDPFGSNPNDLYNGAMSSNAFGGIDFVAANSPGFKYVVKANMGNKPVNYVSWFDAARFADWMHNGQGVGGTELGSYDMTIATPLRLPGATIFLPSVDKWYKAAFYAPGSAAANGNDYWNYQTQSDIPPVPEAPPGGTNSANLLDRNQPARGPTDVGSYINSVSHYGLFDMAGNVWEWTEGVDYAPPGYPPDDRLIRGASFIDTPSTANYVVNPNPNLEFEYIGFRLASTTAVSEHSTGMMGLLGALVTLIRRNRSRGAPK